MSDEDYTQGIASVFANPQDVARYREAIQSGASEHEALNVGDNGVGAWGDDTTSTEDPIVSLPPDTPGFERNKLVEIEGPKGKVVARIADKMPETAHLKGKANIDLNPAAAIAVGHPGGVTPVKWKFVNNEPQSNFLGDPSSLALGNGDLSAANIPAAPPGTPRVNPIPGVPHGISSLTPIGDPNATTIDSTTTSDDSTNDNSSEDAASAIEDSQDANLISESNNQPETTLPAPDVRGLKRTIDQKTGAVVFGDPNSTSSIRYFPDDHAEMMVGPQKWVMMPGQNKFIPIKSILKQDRETGAMIDYTDPQHPIRLPIPEDPNSASIGEKTGEDAIKGLSERDQAFVKGYGNFKLAPPTASLSRNPTFARLYPYIMAYNPNFSVQNYPVQQQTMKQFGSTATGSAGYNINSINTAMDHLGSLWDKAQSLDNSKLRKYNSIANYVKNETGDPKIVAFNDERTRVATELARAFTGGVPTDVQIKEAQASLDNANSPAQLKAVIQGTIPEMLNARMGELNTAYQRTMGKSYPAIISPRAQNVLNRFGIKDFGGINDTTTNQPPSTEFDPKKVYVDSNGNRAQFVNGKWQAIP